MRVKSALKTWSVLGGMVFSLAMVAGCNSEPEATPAGGAGATKGGTDKGAAPTPAPDKEKKPAP